MMSEFVLFLNGPVAVCKGDLKNSHGLSYFRVKCSFQTIKQTEYLSDSDRLYRPDDTVTSTEQQASRNSRQYISIRRAQR